MLILYPVQGIMRTIFPIQVFPSCPWPDEDAQSQAHLVNFRLGSGSWAVTDYSN